MPLTPLHYPIAYVISKLNDKFSLPGLIVGSMLPDLEIPFLMWVRDASPRLVLHSLLGAATIGTLLSATITVFLYPHLINALFRMKIETVHSKCRFSLGLVISCLLGSISHVLLDVLNHPYNPVFWPFEMATISPVYYALGCVNQASLLIQIFFASLAVILMVIHRKNPWGKLLVG